jgi:hypothetical protein
MTNKIAAYCPEIMTLIREVAKRKDLLKDFRETDEHAQELEQLIKEAQEELKAYLETNDESKELLADIKTANTELKMAVKGAAVGSEFKVPMLMKYYAARAKDEAVEKTIKIGEAFAELGTIIGS